MAYNRQPNVVLAGTALKQNPPASSVTPPGIIPVTLDADIATYTSLGVVQIGSGINVDANGVISVSNQQSGFVAVKLVDFSGRLAVELCGSCADTIQPTNAIRVKFDIIEKNTINPDGRAYVRMYLPTFDSTNKYNIQPYSFDTQINELAP